MNADHRSTRQFLVEWYQPKLVELPLPRIAERLRDGTAALEGCDTPVHLELCMAAPTDEVIYGVFGADDAEPVQRACLCAGCPPDRITEVRTHLSTVNRPDSAATSLPPR